MDTISPAEGSGERRRRSSGRIAKGVMMRGAMMRGALNVVLLLYSLEFQM